MPPLGVLMLAVCPRRVAAGEVIRNGWLLGDCSEVRRYALWNPVVISLDLFTVQFVDNRVVGYLRNESHWSSSTTSRLESWLVYMPYTHMHAIEN